MSTPVPSRAPRVDVRLALSVAVVGSRKAVGAVSVNLSETGILVRSSRIAPIGTVLVLRFKTFRVKAVVIWTKHTDDGLLIGMKFISVGGRVRAALGRIVETGVEGLEHDEQQAEARRVVWSRTAAIGITIIASVFTTVRLVSAGDAKPEDDVLTMDLRRTVAVVVRGIEAFSDREGRLPDRAELVAEGLIDPLVDDQMEYLVNAGGYLVRLQEDSLVAEYDGRIPLERWVNGGRSAR